MTQPRRVVSARRPRTPSDRRVAVEAKAPRRTGASALRVRERGPESATHASGVHAGRVAERAGFEPAVLSHTAFRERHHQPLGHLSAGEDTKASSVGRRPGARAAVRRVSARAAANSSSASSRRMPLTILIRRGRPGCWASWMTVPAAPSRVVRGGEDERLDVALEQRADAHRARLQGREDRRVGEPVACRACGPPRAGRRRPRGRSGRPSPGPDRGPARPSPRRRRRRRRSGRSPRASASCASASASPMNSS